MMKREYHEGPEATLRFENTMKKIFQVSKSSIKPPTITKRTPKKTSKG
jgi:hypothetical protein